MGRVSGYDAQPVVGRVDSFLRRDGRGEFGLLVVQRSAGGSFHGRRWFAGHRRGSRHGRHFDKTGVFAAVHRWNIHNRSRLGYAAGFVFQVHKTHQRRRKTNISPGPAPPSFSTGRVEGTEDSFQIFDRRDLVCVVEFIDIEIALVGRLEN